MSYLTYTFDRKGYLATLGSTSPSHATEPSTISTKTPKQSTINQALHTLPYNQTLRILSRANTHPRHGRPSNVHIYRLLAKRNRHRHAHVPHVENLGESSLVRLCLRIFRSRRMPRAFPLGRASIDFFFDLHVFNERLLIIYNTRVECW